MSNNRLRIYDKFSLGIQLKINQSRKDNRDDYADIKYSADAFILLQSTQIFFSKVSFL